jgi:hypothetical protein
MRPRRNATLLVVLAVVTAASAGCSSSSDRVANAGSPGGGVATTRKGAAGQDRASFTTPSGSVRGFDGTTVRVAGIGVKAQLPGAELGSRARVGRFNATNEIPGVKLDYVEFADDNNDPATALSEARKLVAQDHALAVVGDVSAFNPLPYFKQQHVPYFGIALDNTYCASQPDPTVWGFGFDGCLIPNNPKTVGDSAPNNFKYVSQKTGKAHPTVAIFSADSESGSNAAKYDIPPYSGSGFNVVFAKGIVPAQTAVSDYTPYVEQLLHSDGGKAPDSIVCLLTTDCIPIYSLLQANHYAGVYLSALYSNQVLSAMKGSAAISEFVPFDQPTPALAQMTADVKAVDAKQSPDDLGVAFGYLSTDMFIQALKSVVNAKGKSYISPENVQEAAAHMTWQIQGQAGPTKYPDSTVHPTPLCSAVIYDTGTVWKTVEPYTCSEKTWPVPG